MPPCMMFNKTKTDGEAGMTGRYVSAAPFVNQSIKEAGYHAATASSVGRKAGNSKLYKVF